VASAACFIVPESPKYLYSYKRFKEAKDSLGSIARFNRARGFDKKWVFDTELQEDLKSRRSIPILSSSWQGNNAHEISEEKVFDIINRSEDRATQNMNP
jgi:hypothetical protein